ncbi:MAG TPA: hypothetical protein O0X03_03670 [Methanocorpusculum sp.]|nr:hypothetical protein [Methanocorpusculum sp.]HJK76701.1 hypothetical protein [Methanocorpusculum sp.]
MSKKNTIAGVALVVACVLCVWYVSLPSTEEFSREGTVSLLGEKTVISGDDGIMYIPSTNVLEDCEIGTRIWFTAVVNSSQSELLRGPYKPVDVLNISCM